MAQLSVFLPSGWVGGAKVGAERLDAGERHPACPGQWPPLAAAKQEQAACHKTMRALQRGGAKVCRSAQRARRCNNTRAQWCGSAGLACHLYHISPGQWLPLAAVKALAGPALNKDIGLRLGVVAQQW